MKLSKKALIGYPAGVVTGVTYGLNPLFAIPLMAMGAALSSILFFRYAIAVTLLGCFYVPFLLPFFWIFTSAIDFEPVKKPSGFTERLLKLCIELFVLCCCFGFFDNLLSNIFRSCFIVVKVK